MDGDWIFFLSIVLRRDEHFCCGFRQETERVLAGYNNNVNHLVLMLYARAALAIFTPFTLCAVLFSLVLSLGTRTGLAM
jgi:hypothetical protein